LSTQASYQRTTNCCGDLSTCLDFFVDTVFSKISSLREGTNIQIIYAQRGQCQISCVFQVRYSIHVIYNDSTVLLTFTYTLSGTRLD
jgi:hypothetical protein